MKCTVKSKRGIPEPVFYVIVIAIGALLVVLTFLLSTHISLRKAGQDAENALAHLERQCISYREILASDEVKSLMRLGEQADDLALQLTLDKRAATSEYLHRFIATQGLSCILLIDGQMQPEASLGMTKDEQNGALEYHAVRSVLEAPEKKSLERLNYNGKVFDVAIVARQDTQGVILCAYQQRQGALEQYRTTVEALLSGFESQSGNLLFISDGERIIGTNQDEFYNEMASDIPLLEALEQSSDGEALHRFYSDDTAYFGARARYKSYTLYVVYPQSAVFDSRINAVLITFCLYMFIMLCTTLLHIRIRITHLRDIDRQYETIRAISRIYVSNLLVDIRRDRLEVLYRRGSDEIDEAKRASELIEQFCTSRIDSQYRDGYREFICFHTLSERMGKRDFLEFSFPNLSGTWLLDTIIPKTYDGNGRISTFLLVTKNINEQKQLELEAQHRMESAIEREMQASREKTDFLRRMSHDVRTPINVILGMLEIAMRNPDNAAIQAHCRKKTREAADYLLELVNDVLTLNQYNDGKLTAARQPFLPREALERTLSILEPPAQLKGVSLEATEVDLPDETILGDALWLRQIFQNLLGNAIKYTPTGGFVRCTLKQERGRLIFDCRDNGIGMSEDFQKRMFEPFAQESTERISEYGGIGLGLSVVKKLVNLIGGTIEVHSAVGKGTHFIVSLPYTAAASAARITETTQARLDGIRVLLAEDNALNAEIAEYLLKDAGAAVTCVSNGRQALHAFADSAPGKFDIILMDMMMPDMDGLCAAQSIRALARPDAQSVPILALTANLFPQDIEACRRAGMNDHIGKPLDAATFIPKILKTLQKGSEDNHT